MIRLARPLFAALLCAAPALAGEVKTPGAGVPVVPSLGAAALPGPVAILPTDAVKGTVPGNAASQGVAGAPVAVPTPALPIVERAVEAVAPQFQALERPQASPAESAQAGRRIEEAVVGGRSIAASAAVAVPAEASAGGASLPKAASDGSAKAPAPPAPPAGPKKASRGVDSPLSYGLRRAALKAVASLTGVVMTLPQAGPRLSASLIERAAGKTAVFTDFDDTLGPWAGQVPAETIPEMTALLRAGKLLAVVTDRPSLKPAGRDVTVLHSLSNIPAAERRGLIAASKKDGYILQYDAAGEPKVLFEEPPLSEDEWTRINAAASAVIARLDSFGTAKAFENPGPMAYALILKAGTPEAAVVAVAKALEAELRQRGVGYEVEPRMAKDPTKEPYVTFSKIDKSWATRRIAELKGILPGDALILGDSMYAPARAAATLRARLGRRLGELLGGREMPLTGNATDRDMEKGLRGALTLSVGSTADPRMPNAFVLDGKGPAVTARVLAAAAREAERAQARTRLHGGGPKAKADGDVHPALQLLLVVLLIAAAVAGWYFFYAAFADIVRQGQDVQYEDPFQGFY